MELTVKKIEDDPYYQAMQRSSYGFAEGDKSLVRDSSCRLEINGGPPSVSYMTIQNEENGNAIHVYKPNGDKLLLAPASDVTAQESLYLCRLMVGICAGSVRGVKNDHAGILNYIEVNGLCRHFRIDK